MIGRLVYRPVGALLGAAGGALAGAVFHGLWKRATGRDETPSAKAEEYGWREVLIAAALQGAVFGLVKAAVDRSGAAGYRRLTGHWPVAHHPSSSDRHSH